MMLKGTQRRLAVSMLTLTALSPVAVGLLARPASAAFPKGDPVTAFKYKFVATSHIAKLKKTIAPPAGTFNGSLDTKTGQLQGAMTLPPVTFTDPSGGLMTATAKLVPTKAMTGHIKPSNSQITATATFLIKVVSASASAASLSALPHANSAETLPTLPITLPTLPGVTLPPVTLPTVPTVPGGPTPATINLTGTSCSSATPITMVLHGIQHPNAPTKLTGTFAIPKFKACGALTALLSSLLAGPGNTFSGTATSSTGTSSPPPGLTLPTLPITLPTLPGGVTLPTLPGVTLPTLPVTLPTLPVTLPSITLPTLPITLPTLPVTLPTVTLPSGH